MKKIFFSLAVLLTAAFSNNANAQATESTAVSGADLVTPLTIIETTPINFGVIASGNSGTIEVPAADGVFVVSGPTIVNATAQSRGVFAVTGGGSMEYVVTLGAPSTLLHGSDSMDLDSLNFYGDDNDANSAGSTVLSTNGTQTLYVGGTLTVVANQPAGVYEGDYLVTVNYN